MAAALSPTVTSAGSTETLMNDRRSWWPIVTVRAISPSLSESPAIFGWSEIPSLVALSISIVNASACSKKSSFSIATVIVPGTRSVPDDAVKSVPAVAVPATVRQSTVVCPDCGGNESIATSKLTEPADSDTVRDPGVTSTTVRSRLLEPTLMVILAMPFWILSNWPLSFASSTT